MARQAQLRIDRRPTALYFPAVTTLLLMLSLVAFSDNLFTDIHQPSNSDPQMIIHGLFAASWMALLATQAWLVNLRIVELHRRIGPYAFLAGAGMALTTAYLFYSRFKGFAAMEAEVIANRLLLPVFIASAWLAWRNRRRPDWHKRLLLVGTFALLEPITARIYDPLFGWAIPLDIDKTLDDQIFLIYLFGTWAALLASLWWYDRAVAGRIHPVTKWGGGAIAAMNAIAYMAEPASMPPRATADTGPACPARRATHRPRGRAASR